LPELPDVELYLSALRSHVAGQRLNRARLTSPFLLRTVSPPLDALHGRRVERFERAGKRIVWQFEGHLFAIFHLMIAGRFRWRDVGAAIPGKVGLLAFDFDTGTLLLTEAGSKKQASLHIVEGRAAVDTFDPGGVDVSSLAVSEFATVLRRENHTLKRALTDPRLFSGIGNAYSDEILHEARLSPLKLTGTLTEPEVATLHRATVDVLDRWTRKLMDENGSGFPEKVTAFGDGMAAHGRFGKPCPVCGTAIQRIVYAHNEANYCPTCQTGGRLLADRALSRLLRNDWPSNLEALRRIKTERRR
jgi:formamidopyrimidine-DNA glycosylase